MEDEHFARLDREKIDKLRTKREVEAAEARKVEQRTLHHHRCGKCGEHMETKLHRGVRIEVCPACGAVLLDKGELETLAGKDKSGLLTGVVSLFGGDKD